MEEARKEYDAMLENGDLEILFPDMTQDWKKDKNKFIKMWSKNQELIKNEIKPNK